MPRLLAVIAIAALAFAFTPGTASAQFRGMYSGSSPLYIYPTGNGYGVGLNYNINAMSPYGPISFGYLYPYYSPPSYAPTPPPVPSYSGGGGYLTGGSYSSYDSFGLQAGLQGDLAQAQQAAAKMNKSQDQARDMIDAQWAYEKLGVSGKVALTGAQEQVEELQKALGTKDEAEIASGAALNRILIAIVVAEGKGAKGVAAFLPPRLLDDLRFKGDKGEASADLLNLVRQTGKIPFPANFPGDTLAENKAAVETDFAAAIAPLQAGKAIDLTKVNKLEASFKKLEAASPPVIRTLAFEDAVAARRFLNQFNSAIKALKSGSVAGLINPKWATDGISVSDLVKHMTKYKLLFAHAPVGGEGSYTTLHKALATYLF